MLHFVCAFLAEAIPLIEGFDLDKLNGEHAFDVYTNYQKSITLTISGLGKLASASAVTYTYSLFDCQQGEAWMNIGIAGHGHAVIGDLYFASSVLDKASEQRWYPQFCFDVTHNKAECITVDKPSEDYNGSMLDMEASGFYSSSIRFSNFELVHVIKIISDNSAKPYNKIDKSEVTELIQHKMPFIQGYTNRIAALAKEFNKTTIKPSHYETMVKQWHFTKSQQFQLEKQLRRWDVLKPKDKPLPIFIHSKDARSLLSEMTNMLDNMDVVI